MQEFLNKLENGQKVTVVALGDSITELTWHTAGRLSWVGYLQEALFETYGRNRCCVINSGRCGDTAAEGANRLEEDVLRFNPDLVIISYGMNDASGDVEEFRTALASLIDRVRDHNGAAVLLRTPNPIVNPPPTVNSQDGQEPAVETAGTKQSLFAATIVEVADQRGCAVVDHYKCWKRLEERRGVRREEPNELWLHMSDCIHPGPLGHLAFFRELAPLFKVPSTFPWE